MSSKNVGYTMQFMNNPIYKVFENNNLNNNNNMKKSFTMKMDNQNLLNNMNNNSANNNYNNSPNNNYNNNQNNNMNMNMNMGNLYNKNNTMINNNINNWNINYQFKNNNTISNFNRMNFINYNNLKDISRILPKNNVTINYDDFPEYQGRRFNIIFQIPQGNKINIFCPIDTKVKHLLSKFIERMGLGQETFEKSLYFLFSGTKLDKHEERTITEIGMHDSSVIIVIDVKSVIGA